MIVEIIIAAAVTAIAVKYLPHLIVLSSFSYANAKFNAIPNDFINEKEIERLLDSSSIDELKGNVVSRDFILKGDTVEEIQRSIDYSLIKIIEMAKNDSPKNVRTFYDAYMKKIDVDSLKDALKCIVEGREVKNRAVTPYMKNLIENLKNVSIEDASFMLKAEGWNVNINDDWNKIEKDIERNAIEFIKNARLPKSSGKARDKFVGCMIDILNLKSAARSIVYGIPAYYYGNGWEIQKWKLDEISKLSSIDDIVSSIEGTSYAQFVKNSRDIHQFEKSLDMCLLKIVADISNENFMSIGPGIRFVVEKEYEAMNLKAVVKAVGERMKEVAKEVVIV
ncbi:MAG: V-type ATPase subunit [Thermoplasmata archaeon]|nr:V-type ATPase subunit [Thermoplasmata archaeon]